MKIFSKKIFGEYQKIENILFNAKYLFVDATD